MNQKSCAFAVTAALLAASFAAGPSVAQKQGGILKIYMLDSPASMSIHEEATVVAERPVMGVFNNLVMFDQHVQQNNLGSIVPDLAIGWSWNEDGTDLTVEGDRSLRSARRGRPTMPMRSRSTGAALRFAGFCRHPRAPFLRADAEGPDRRGRG